MDLDFALILTVATFVTGLIWLFDVIFLKPGRQKRAVSAVSQLRAESVEPLSVEVEQKAHDQVMRESLIVEYAHSFFPVLAVVWVLRSFLFEPFTIPSGSMLPTLEVGDYILVSKYSYGLRLPVVGTKVVSLGDPQRGDIMVFKYPENPRINYIKRVIGVPGDRIAIEGNMVFLNGKLIARDVVRQEPEINPWQLYYEQKLDTSTFNIRELVGAGTVSGEWLVPEGSYFTLGDNRNESRDSRYWGFVPDEYVVGKAFYIWIHKKPGLNLPVFSRNGNVE